MLKIEKLKEEIEREKRHYFCNICGKEIESKYDCGKKVTIKYIYEYNNDYDGGYDESSYVYDICPECFEQEIKPFLDKKIGNREEEENYYG